MIQYTAWNDVALAALMLLLLLLLRCLRSFGCGKISPAGNRAKIYGGKAPRNLAS